MLPRTLRTLIVVAVALFTIVAGVRASLADVRWVGISIWSSECGDCDGSRADDSGRLSEEVEEDQDDEDGPPTAALVPHARLGRRAPAIPARSRPDRVRPLPIPPGGTLVRGPPAAV